jgi:hypothetical protein
VLFYHEKYDSISLKEVKKFPGDLMLGYCWKNDYEKVNGILERDQHFAQKF